ncbi:MAG: hypothetical protein AAEJ65_05300 [Planctomycetota bacterium]
MSGGFLPWILLIPLSVLPMQSVPDDDAGLDATTENSLPEPIFKTDEGRKTFEQGKELFEQRDWRGAGKAFTAARRDTVDRESRSRLEPWEDACKGGKSLDRAAGDLVRKKYRKCWSAVEGLVKKYGDTPLRTSIDELHDEVYPILFLDLAKFEKEPVETEQAARRALPEDRTRITKDPDRIFEGKSALEWRSGGGQGFAGFNFGRLPLASIEDVVMEDYRWLRISIHSEDDNFGKFTLFFGRDEIGPNQAWAATGGIRGLLRRDCYYHHLTIKKKGWTHLRIDLVKELSKNESISWSDLQSLYLFTVPPSHPKRLTIDALKLEVP